MASISFQCLFKLYGKLSGMTGTASTEEELYTIYGLNVVEVPTNKPIVASINPTPCSAPAGSETAAADLVVSCHWEGRPCSWVPPASRSPSTSPSSCARIQVAGARDNAGGGRAATLNARPQLAAKEAEIVAGQPNAITIATNMAGRGTDIVLGGNPTGLARLYLERLLLPKLSPGTVEAEDATEPNPMASVATSMKTDAAVRAAIGLAYMTAKADEALPVSAESVVALVVEAVEHAESILRGGAVRAAAEEAAAEEEKRGVPIRW